MRLQLCAFIFILAGIAGVSIELRSQDKAVLWPTDASEVMTSSFGEYRSGHVHAGIDIKTWGKTGYKVFAVANGSIIRIRVSPYGYGRALYHKLDNGMTVVYAHLSAFSDSIESIVYTEQERKNRFQIDKWLISGAVPVRKGEVIGYTGRSGCRDPHLHFEVRNAQNHPINPLSLGYAIEDFVGPRVSSVSVTPVFFGSHVAGDFKPKRFPVLKSGGSYILPDSIPVWGAVGISVSAYDQSEAASNRFAPYKMEMAIDEIPVFTVKYDQFSYSVSRDVELDRDYRLKAWGWGLYQKLYRDRGNQLPFYEPDRTWAGLVHCWDNVHPGHGDSEQIEKDSFSVERGPHTLRISVSDFFGNSTDIHGTLYMIPVSELLYSSFKERPPDNGTLPMEWSSANIDIEKMFFDQYVFYRIRSDEPLAGTPSLLLETNGWDKEPVSLFPKSSQEFIGIWPWKSGMDGLLISELKFMQPFGQTRTVQDTLKIAMISQEKGGLVLSGDGYCRISFGPGSVYGSFLAYCLEENFQDSSQGTKIYNVFPQDVPLREAAEIQIGFSDSGTHDEKCGIYRVGSQGAAYMETSRDEGRLTARTLELGRFTVLEDTVPPVILNVLPAPGSVIRDPLPRITVSFRDTLSGISGEDNYLVWIDGKRCIVEYDPVMEAAYPLLRAPVAEGKHTLQVFLKDRAGNIAIHESHFTLSR